MSRLVNLYCISNTNFQLVTKENFSQNRDCFFIIADIDDKKIYCYRKRELEMMHSTHQFKIEGIVFNAVSPDILVRWENRVNNPILDVKVKAKQTIYQQLYLKDDTYSIARVLPTVTFHTRFFVVSALAATINKQAAGSVLPAIELVKDANLTTDILRNEISNLQGITRLTCEGTRLEEIDFENLNIRGMVNLSGAFAYSDTLKRVRLGKLDLYNLDSVFHMLLDSRHIETIDFSQSNGDISQKIDWRNPTNLGRFNLADCTCFNRPLIVYLNKDSVLFNKVLVQANPRFNMLTGVVPYSDRETRAKVILGKERLIKGVKELQQGYFIRVDNTK